METDERRRLLRPAPPTTAGSLSRQFIAAFAVDLMAFAFGMGMGWSSTALPLLMSAESPLVGGPISQDDASWLASVLCITSMLTTPIYHYLCEHFGRRTCAYTTVLPGILSILILIFGNSRTSLYISRVLIGLCFAGTFIYCPIYITEIAENKIRGALGVFLMLMRNTGILTSYVIGAYFSFRTVSWLCLIAPLLFLFSLLWLPESPVFLLRQGRYEEAVHALSYFRGRRADIREEIERMTVSLESMDSQGDAPATVRELITDKTAQKALVITFVLFCNQQLCGFYGIVSYSVTIFQESGSNWSADTCSIIVGVMLVCGTLFSTLICDFTGRKILLVLSDILMALTLFILAVYFYCKEKEMDVSGFTWVPVTCLSVYVIVLNIGLSSLPVLIATELFSPRFTSLGMTITAPSTWFLTFLVAKYFPLMSDTIGIHGSCVVFALICTLGSVYIILFLPETKNKPLEEILNELKSGWIMSNCYRRKRSRNNIYRNLYAESRDSDSECVRLGKCCTSTY